MKGGDFPVSANWKLKKRILQSKQEGKPDYNMTRTLELCSFTMCRKTKFFRWLSSEPYFLEECPLHAVSTSSSPLSLWSGRAPATSSDLLSSWLTTASVLPNWMDIVLLLFLYLLISKQHWPCCFWKYSFWFLGYHFLLVCHLLVIYVSSFTTIQLLNVGNPERFVSCLSMLFPCDLIQSHGSDTI